MANQRAQVAMTEAEAWDFVAEQRCATMGTVGPDGAIHLVGMWFALLDGRVWFETKRKAQKAANLRRNPRLSVLVQAGETYDELRGVSVEGTGVVVEDEQVVWDVCVAVFERYHGRYSEEARPLVELMARNRVAVRLDAQRIRSWDHRKLGL